jgi:AcrR family transcriptional regulator
MTQVRMTRREQSAIETRNIIFETAVELFSERGYDRVTVDDICDKAGVSKGTFYNHFKSKDQVIIEEFLKVDDFYQEILSRLKNKKSYIDKLTTGITLTLRYISGMGINTIKVAYQSQIGPNRASSPVASQQRALYQIVEQHVREAQENGEARTDISAASITNTLVRFVRGLVYDWCLQNGDFDLQKAGKDYLAIVIDGLRPR